MKKYLINESCQARFLTAPFKTSITDSEADVAYDQNQLVRNYVIKSFGINPIQISRDSQGHILIFAKNQPEINSISDRVYCYILGSNSNKNTLNLYIAGYFEWQKYNHTGANYHSYSTFHVKRIAVNPNLRCLSIGNLLIKVAENMAVKQRCNHITLNALKSYDVRNDIVIPSAKLIRAIKRIKQPELNEAAYSKLKNKNHELESFLRGTLFNRNLYFYNVNNYIFNDNEVVNDDRVDPLIKKHIQQTSLELGVERPINTKAPSHPLYKLPAKDDPIISLFTSHNYNLFPESWNPVDFNDLVLLNVEPNRQGTEKLKRLISSLLASYDFTR